MSEISEYKEECMRRFKKTQKYQKYDKEDLIDELYEKDNLLQQKENIIKEVREYIEQLLEYKKEDYYKGVSLDYVERILDILKGDLKYE